jgi:AcrR family transcriptional regulator
MTVVADTRQRLVDGAIETVRAAGIAGASARAIAAAAGVNQALIFYHFGSVRELLVAACESTTEARVAPFRDRLDSVGSVRELLAVGRDLHVQERALGNVAVLAQLLAGAQSDPVLAEATAAALALWIAPLERSLDRLLTGSPLSDLVDVPALARAVAAGFIGLELYEGVDPAGASAALDALDRLAALIDVADELPPIAIRALRRTLARRV